jgi:hypothetical protein
VSELLPFDINEYRKDPSRLRHYGGGAAEWSMEAPDGSIAARWRNGTADVYSPTRMVANGGMAHYLRLAERQMRLPAASVQWTELQQRQARILLGDALALLVDRYALVPTPTMQETIGEIREALTLPATVAAKSPGMHRDEKLDVIREMRKHGGTFVRQLAETWAAADDDNARRIEVAFADCVEKYRLMATPERVSA